MLRAIKAFNGVTKGTACDSITSTNSPGTTKSSVAKTSEARKRELMLIPPSQRQCHSIKSPTLSKIRLHVRKTFLAKPAAGNLACRPHRLAIEVLLNS